VHGTAYAPHGLPHATFSVSIAVADVVSRVRVTGPRSFRRTRSGFAVTEPDRVASVPLVHELAFGGPGIPANPIGKGAFESEADADGQPLPLLEDAEARPVASPRDRPSLPAFGAVAPHWAPRSNFAGTYDGIWRKTRAPLLPRDFDPRFFCAAPQALCTARPLVGGEPVELDGLSPAGRLLSRVPRLPLRIVAGSVSYRPRIDRCVVEPDTDRCVLTVRQMLLPGKRLRIVEKRMVTRALRRFV